LIGASHDDDKILSFALDRIDEVISQPEIKYHPCHEDLAERYDDIVGVTLYEDRKIEHILCWVSDVSKEYIDTKPIHGSYTPIKGEAEVRLHKNYPTLNGGMFFTLDCIPNYELIRELCSFGKELLVLESTGTIIEKVKQRVSEMAEQYRQLEKS
jgi:predicted DNA-binding transcriptional regulator YafY